jgi:alkylresorcinol/alkylpyrone synthase
MSRVLSVAPALPANAYPQEQISAVIGPLLTDVDGGPDGGRGALLAKLHAHSGVTTRHVALPLEEYAGLTSFGQANDHFVRVGTDLAEQAARSALQQAGVAPDAVDFLFFTTVTGVSAPSLDALLVGRLGLRPDVRRMPSFGLGCAAGAAGLALVHDYLVGHPKAVALLVSVELCSLTLQQGDASTPNLVSTGIFGDGAAAVVMVGDEHPSVRQGAPPGAGPRQVEVVDSLSHLYAGTAGQLGWRVADTGFRILLSAGLPDVVAGRLNDDVIALLERNDLKTRDVASWVVHAGGPRILDAVQRSLDLDSSALDLSWESLAQVGNLSSASVLHVLDSTMRADPPAGGWVVVVAFGPGVSAELVLMRWADDA